MDALLKLDAMRRVCCCLRLDFDHHYVVEIQWRLSCQSPHDKWDDMVQVVQNNKRNNAQAIEEAIDQAYNMIMSNTSFL